MRLTKESVCSLIVVVFHLVGFIGFSIPQLVPVFKQLVPGHLLLMLLLLLLSHRDRNGPFGVFLLVVYLAGYFIEFIGVHTGMIFGQYFYKTTLGYKVAEIPLMIGVNWVLVIYSAGAFIYHLGLRNKLVSTIISAALVTLMDVLIEPVAIRFDYWDWVGQSVPLQNYLAWFLFSLVVSALFFYLNFEKRNPTGAVLFVVQFLFFIALNVKAA
ncbi:carotenoid biosynthesis protein [Pedobacter sp. SYSU D00535]|uniref:carotenoid biosynthesis protein n=1 Tax=Pedobacter sp. SYSU D00535 TaxID=2810308 RepID=UPI001F619B03|nr:carotenoid biosynthesis protein [Pedobacter sp. SYSU D00535]